ncbi:MAG: M20/M25/M40 family metallo-hydrolase [Trueperaceae bacterium]
MARDEDVTRGSGERSALLDTLVAFTETASPTFDEARRAALLLRRWQDAGADATLDGVGNVVATVPGGRGPRVLMAAHLDSVFGPDVDVRVRREGSRWRAPGIGDNAASLAVLTHFLQDLPPESERPRLTLAGTVGEEGLGDLRGARHLVESLGEDHDLFVAVDGHLGVITDRAVGSRRYEARFRGHGGHAWGDYPSPSAVHAAGEAIARLIRLSVPGQPRSSMNVGQVWGGTSVNAIAEEAGFNLDLRSVERPALDVLTDVALQRIESAARDQGCTVEVVKVGDRPVGAVDNRALVASAKAALRAVGERPRLAAGSTDANAAVAAGIPSIAFGVYHGGDAHRLEEWIEPDSLAIGLRALRELLRRLAR